jgi:predicted transcriptional regulator
MMEKRSSIDIVSRILEAANGGASKMQIMHRAVLSYKQVKEYANFLTERGLLTYDNSRQGGDICSRLLRRAFGSLKDTIG